MLPSCRLFYANWADSKIALRDGDLLNHVQKHHCLQHGAQTLRETGWSRQFIEIVSEHKLTNTAFTNELFLEYLLFIVADYGKQYELHRGNTLIEELYEEVVENAVVLGKVGEMNACGWFKYS